MKKIILLIITLIQNSQYSQTAEYNKLDKEGDFTSYITKIGRELKINDKIRIGYAWNKEKFTFITQGGQGITSALAETEIQIEKIKVIKIQNGYTKALIQFKGFGLLPVIIDIEPAIKTEEIIIQ